MGVQRQLPLPAANTSTRLHPDYPAWVILVGSWPPVNCHRQWGLLDSAGAPTVDWSRRHMHGIPVISRVRSQSPVDEGERGAILRPLGAPIPHSAGRERTSGGPGAPVLRGAGTPGCIGGVAVGVRSTSRARSKTVNASASAGRTAPLIRLCRPEEAGCRTDCWLSCGTRPGDVRIEITIAGGRVYHASVAGRLAQDFGIQGQTRADS